MGPFRYPSSPLHISTAFLFSLSPGSLRSRSPCSPFSELFAAYPLCPDPGRRTLSVCSQTIDPSSRRQQIGPFLSHHVFPFPQLRYSLNFSFLEQRILSMHPSDRYKTSIHLPPPHPFSAFSSPSSFEPSETTTSPPSRQEEHHFLKIFSCLPPATPPSRKSPLSKSEFFPSRDLAASGNTWTKPFPPAPGELSQANFPLLPLLT